MILYDAVFFALGAIAASFAGVLAGRLHTGEGFLTGRSRCDACGKPLTPSALVPIFSYVFSGGRARCCGARLSATAPLSELALGALFVLAYLHLGSSPALPFLLLALVLLLTLVLYDLSHAILPPSLLTAFILAAVLTGLFEASSFSAFLATLPMAVAISGVLALIHFASGGRAMGFSDAPLAFGLALLTGPAALPGFVFSFWIGAVIGIALLFGRAPGSRMGVEVPFAPFLAAGFLLAYFTQWNPFIFAAAAVLTMHP